MLFVDITVKIQLALAAALHSQSACCGIHMSGTSRSPAASLAHSGCKVQHLDQGTRMACMLHDVAGLSAGPEGTYDVT